MKPLENPLFVKFLEENGILERYKERFDKDYYKRESRSVYGGPDYFVSVAFLWHNTPEQSEFWYTIDNRWRGFLESPTKLHRLLKGIENENH